ncbi:MAG: hypothetical protein JW862_18115, partial [Anaerolineales bacterium]|nr:hypothetical protein [Anaerolineales bacterium]
PILESFALGLPLLLVLDDVRRSGVVVGVVYFLIYLLTSYASRSADRFSRRFDGLARPVNLTYLLGVGMLVVAGLAAWQELRVIAILVFVGFYLLQNLRKPLNVALISEQIDQKVMASGLSVEAQMTTLLVVIFAPLLGALADWAGVGLALACFGLLTLGLYVFARVETRHPAQVS